MGRGVPPSPPRPARGLDPTVRPRVGTAVLAFRPEISNLRFFNPRDLNLFEPSREKARDRFGERVHVLGLAQERGRARAPSLAPLVGRGEHYDRHLLSVRELSRAA